MKKLLTILIALTLIIPASIPVFAAEKVGKLISIDDVVTKDGENANIKEHIKAVTNSNGDVYFPCYKNSEINKITLEKGMRNGDIKVIKNGDIKYNVLNFNEKNKEVIFDLDITMEKTYIEKKAKIGNTLPSGVGLIEFKVKNNSPLNIENYTVSLAAPNGDELLNIVDFDAEKSYKVFKKDGKNFGSYVFGKVKSGNEIKLSINVYKKNQMFNYIVWGIAIIISILFMIKNRDLLKKAKEEKLKKKSLKN